MKASSIDEFYSVTPNYKGFRVTFWAFPVKDTTGNDVYLVIEDQFRSCVSVLYVFQPGRCEASLRV